MAITRATKSDAGNIDTFNKRLFDSTLQHQIGIRSLSTGEVSRIISVLDDADIALSKSLREFLPALVGKPFDRRSKKLLELLKKLTANRDIANKKIRDFIRLSLLELADIEAEFEVKAIQNALDPIQVEVRSPTKTKLRDVVDNKPFSLGLNSSQTLALLLFAREQADNSRLVGALQLGLQQGDGVDGIVQRIVGRKSSRFQDGILAINRRNTETVVRTAINHVSNAAREEVWIANSDIVGYVKWVATLDGRTTPICRSLDGKNGPVGGVAKKGSTIPQPHLVPPGIRPPVHAKERSIMAAILNGLGIVGRRPFVVDTKTGKKRTVSFATIAKRQGISVAAAKKQWISANVGTVPAKVTYNQWLKTQTASFQDEVLGKTRGRLFRSGSLDVTEFVDKQGNNITLKQLAKSKPEAFGRANLDPDDFL